jgi:hypothetical protein
MLARYTLCARNTLCAHCMHMRTNTPAEDVSQRVVHGHWTLTDFSDFLHCFCKTYYCNKRDGDGDEY